MLLEKHYEDKNMVTKRLIFKTFLDNLKEKRREKQKFRTMADHFRKF